IQHVGMTVRRGMLDFVLEFLQAIVREGQKELYAFVGRLRVADFVGFNGRKIILLRRCLARENRRGGQEAASHQEKMRFEAHGFFSAGGEVACWSEGRRGNSISSSSFCMAMRSWWRISRAGF